MEGRSVPVWAARSIPGSRQEAEPESSRPTGPTCRRRGARLRPARRRRRYLSVHAQRPAVEVRVPCRQWCPLSLRRFGTGHAPNRPGSPWPPPRLRRGAVQPARVRPWSPPGRVDRLRSAEHRGGHESRLAARRPGDGARPSAGHCRRPCHVDDVPSPGMAGVALDSPRPGRGDGPDLPTQAQAATRGHGRRYARQAEEVTPRTEAAAHCPYARRARGGITRRGCPPGRW